MRHVSLLAAASLAACASGAAARPAAFAQVGAAEAAAATPAQPSAPMGGCNHAVPAACDGSPPEYARDVRPILERRCLGCHSGDGVAADEHDFSRVEALRGAHKAIVDDVSACAMPPRSRLDDDEAGTLLRWAVCGQATH